MAQHKAGYITASTVAPFLTGESGKLIAGGIKAAKVIAGERCGMIDPELDNNFSGSTHTDWGNEHEPDAIAAYEREKFVAVHGMQEQIELLDIDGIPTKVSCTPDGLVGDEGMVEVKCPSVMFNHMQNVLADTWKDDYYDQCQFQLMCSGRKWVDLISYDPRQPEWAQLHVVRIAKDEMRIAEIRDRIKQAEEVIADELMLVEAKRKAKEGKV